MAQQHEHPDCSEQLTRIELFNGVYVVTIDQLGLIAEGEHIEEILEDLLYQIRDYINDWHDLLADKEPHVHNKQLVQQLEQADRDGTLPQMLNGSTGANSRASTQASPSQTSNSPTSR